MEVVVGGVSVSVELMEVSHNFHTRIHTPALAILSFQPHPACGMGILASHALENSRVCTHSAALQPTRLNHTVLHDCQMLSQTLE